MKKKLISALLLISILASLASCGGGASDGGDTTPKADDTTAQPVDTDHDANGFLLDSIPADTNFGGATVNLLVREKIAPTEFFVEEQTGDIVDDALVNLSLIHI